MPFLFNPLTGTLDRSAAGSGGGGVTSVNSITGAVTLVAGSGITVTPSGSDITIASTGGGSTNSFTTIQPDNGTSPVATSPTDTLTLHNSDGNIIITGNSGTDTITYSLATDVGISGTIQSPIYYFPGGDNMSDGTIGFNALSGDAPFTFTDLGASQTVFTIGSYGNGIGFDYSSGSPLISSNGSGTLEFGSTFSIGTSDAGSIGYFDTSTGVLNLPSVGVSWDSGGNAFLGSLAADNYITLAGGPGTVFTVMNGATSLDAGAIYTDGAGDLTANSYNFPTGGGLGDDGGGGIDTLGSGNLTVGNNLTVEGNTQVGTFEAVGGPFAVNSGGDTTVNSLQINSSFAAINSGGGAQFTSIITLNSTIDDGSGNADFGGSVTATSFYGDGSNLTNLPGPTVGTTNIPNATPSAFLYVNSTGGTLESDTSTTDGSGNISATSFTASGTPGFVGDGSGLTGIVSSAPGSTGDILFNNGGVISADTSTTDGSGNLTVNSLTVPGGSFNSDGSFTLAFVGVTSDNFGNLSAESFSTGGYIDGGSAQITGLTSTGSFSSDGGTITTDGSGDLTAVALELSSTLDFGGNFIIGPGGSGTNGGIDSSTGNAVFDGTINVGNGVLYTDTFGNVIAPYLLFTNQFGLLNGNFGVDAGGNVGANGTVSVGALQGTGGTPTLLANDINANGWALTNVNNINFTAANQTTYSGSVSGSAVWSMPFQGASYKKFVINLSALNDAGGTIAFPIAFSVSPYLYGNAAAVAVSSANTTTFTLTATAGVTGNVFVEGA